MKTVSLVLSFLLGFFLEATLGMVGFWILEVSSLLFVYQLFSFFFSGQMFPIDILPDMARNIVTLGFLDEGAQNRIGFRVGHPILGRHVQLFAVLGIEL